MRNLYLDNRFFYAFAAIIVLFVLGHEFYFLYKLGQIALIVLFCFVSLDVFWLFFDGTQVDARRRLPKVLSLSDENKIFIDLKNKSNRSLTFFEVHKKESCTFCRRYGSCVSIGITDEKI